MTSGSSSGSGLLTPGRRRALAVVALLASLAMAWWTWQGRTETAQVVWLLTHVEVAVDGVVLDRSRLAELSWWVSQGSGSQPGRRQTLWFSPGTAPEATRAVLVELPARTAEVEIACRFALTSDSAGIRTRTRLRVDRRQDGQPQVVDIGTCGDRVP